jgi:uncharacterized membrane protein
MKETTRNTLRKTPRHLLVGLLTVAPLWITWVVFDFLFTQLSRAGAPWVIGLAHTVRPFAPGLADWLLTTWFQSLLATLFTLALLYAVGRVAGHVLGQRFIAALEAWLQRIPLVAMIYGSTKRLLSVMREKPAGAQRVVLINFPSREMKAVGFLTRVIEDEDTGRELAVVYMPTAPNPTSGYIEIVPLDRVTQTDWTMDEAMSFIISGGTSAPARIRYGPIAAEQEAPPCV